LLQEGRRQQKKGRRQLLEGRTQLQEGRRQQLEARRQASIHQLRQIDCPNINVFSFFSHGVLLALMERVFTELFNLIAVAQRKDPSPGDAGLRIEPGTYRTAWKPCPTMTLAKIQTWAQQNI
jgi:hypothetical protein